MGRNAFRRAMNLRKWGGATWSEPVDNGGRTPDQAAKQRLADRAAEDARELAEERARDAAAPKRVAGMKEHDDTAALLERLEKQKREKS